MKPVLKFAICFVLILLEFIASCKKDKENLSPAIKLSPRANAGPDQFIVLPADSVELSGSGTDADGTIVSYKWNHVSGPSSFTIINPNNAITEVKKLVEGVYVFELIVSDNDGLSAKDEVVIAVVTSANDPCLGCWDY